MRVTIDLDRDIIIIPDNFFKKIGEENEKLEKYGATAVDPLVRIWHTQLYQAKSIVVWQNTFCCFYSLLEFGIIYGFTA